MMKKYIQASLLAVFALILIRCNAAEEEFNAPAGSTVEFLTGDIELQFAGPGEVLLLVTTRVNVPVGLGTPESGNKIHGVISCARCNLYIFKDGVETYLPQSSLLDPVAAGSFAFNTDAQGLYTFAIGVRSPSDLGFINADGDLVSYSDGVIADIRVAQATLGITAGPAE